MSNRGDTVRIATRGSALARRQAAMIEAQLTRRRLSVELVEVETTGDQITDELIHRLGTTGAFVRSLDEKVLSGELDAAVHSMKDMPTEQPEELVIAGTPERGSAGDVLVTPDDRTLAELPEGATIGTSSLRRKAQLLAERPDLDIQPLRGNVDTRVQKLLAPPLQREHEARLDAAKADGNEAEEHESEYDQTPEEWFDSLSELERQALGHEVETEYDAICLAEVGLERSSLLDRVPHECLDPTTVVPAPAQGTIAVTALDGEFAERLHEVLDHPHTRIETTVERTILDDLGGGCVAPVGIHGRLQGEYVNTTVRVLAQDGSEQVRASRDIPVQRHAAAAREFARELAEQGAAELIEQARRDEPDEPKRS